ncbi:10538_t:CDS:2, partial [Rhizophagus irregularis]
NTYKRSHSKFMKYEQNNEGLLVLSSPLSKTSSQQSDTNIGNSDLASAQIAKVQKPSEKLIFNGTQNMAKKPVKKAETPLLRNAFLEKSDFKLNYGKLAFKLYKKLKELLNIISGYSAPKLDRKGFFKSLGTKIFAQEDSILNTRASITNIEIYSIQSNGFRLTILVSKYLFEDTIITIDLQDVEVPRTIKEFLNLVMAVKVILS